MCAIPKTLLAVALVLYLPGIATTQPKPLCAGTVVALNLAASYAPFVHMRLDNREGDFIIDTGTFFSVANGKFFGLALGSDVTLGGSSFPTVTGGKFRVLDLSGHPAPQGARFAGLLGADFLARRIAEFHYDEAQPYVAVSDRACAAPELEGTGFMLTSLDNYPAAQASAVRAMWTNQPLIMIRIGKVTAAAGIDTGFTEFAPELRPGTLQINDALLKQLQTAGVAMQQLRASKNIDCHGQVTERAHWRVQEEPLIVATQNGKPIFSYEPPVLEVLPRDTPCGKIEGSPQPFGLVGALYLKLWGTTVIDFAGERVWLSSKHAAPLYPAVALAWNRDGGWIGHREATLESANQGALASCNQKYGNCSLPGIALEPSSFACLAVARNVANKNKVSAARSGSLKEVRDAVLANCAKQHGGACQIEYTGCNH